MRPDTEQGNLKMIDHHPTVMATVARHQLILSRLTALWDEVNALAVRLAELRLHREAPGDSLEAETERLLRNVSIPGRIAEREAAEARMSTLRGNIRTLEFAAQKAALAVHVARRESVDFRLQGSDVVDAVRELHSAAIALSEAHRRSQKLAEALRAEGVGEERLYWLCNVGWSASAVDAWRRTAEHVMGTRLSEPK